VRHLRTLLPPTFEELPKPLAVGVYDVASGTPMVVTAGDLPLAVAASCAVPGIFSPLSLEGLGYDFDGLAVELGGGRRYADGGKIDRSGVRGWRGWRPGRKALLHLVSELPVGEYGPRDGLKGSEDDLVAIVRTGRARASLVSLGDFEAQVEAAAERAETQLVRALSAG